MTLDYLIGLDCPVKTRLTSEGMMTLLKLISPIDKLIGSLKQAGKSYEEIRQMQFQLQVNTSAGAEIKEVTLSEILNQLDHLNELEETCKSCPANCGRAFGCYNFINYPLSSKAEEWMIRLSNDAIKNGSPRKKLIEWIVETNVTGDLLAKMRASNQPTFLELKKPLNIIVETENLGKKTVNTDQILSALFGVGRMTRPHILAVNLFSGGVKICDNKPVVDPSTLLVRMSDEYAEERWYAFNLPEESGDDKSIAEIKQFFKTIFIAYLLNKEVELMP